MTASDDPSTTGSTSGTESTESASSGAPSVETADVDVSLRPSRRLLLLGVLAVCIVVGATYGISFWRARPDAIRKLFVEEFPRWQLRRGKGWIPVGGPELLAMQATLRRYPEVSAALGRLDAVFQGMSGRS